MYSVNVPILIVGLPRSASKLWAKVIDGHPDVAQFSGLHFLSVWRRGFRFVRNHHAGDLSQEQNTAREGREKL